MSEIRTLGRHAAIYGLGTMLAKLTSFVMLPIYTRFLTPADYGVLELLSMTIDLIGMLTGLTLTASVYPFYNEYKPAGEEKEVMTTAAISVTALAAVTASIGMLAAPLLTGVVLGAHGNPIYFRIFFLIFVTQTAEMVPFLMCRALHRSMLVVTINLARLIGMLSLNILFVVHLRAGVVGILISNLIVSAVVATGMMLFLFREMGYAFSWSKFQKMARYGYPVAFVSLGNFFLVFSDRYFLNHYVGSAAVGLYSLAYRFGFILSAFIFNPFQQIWGPQRFAIATRPNAREIYRRVFLYMNIALGGTALVIALFVRDVLKVMATQAFLPAYRVVPLILIAQILHHWTAYNNLGLLLTKTTRKFAWGSAVAIPSVLLLNFLLIPRYGVWGAATATLIAYVLRLIVINELSQREYRIDYDWSRIFRLYGILGLAFGARALAGDVGIVASTALGGSLVVFAAWAVYTLILNPDERRALTMLMRSKLLERKRVRRSIEERLVLQEGEVDIQVES